jgi:hypothetical protein
LAVIFAWRGRGVLEAVERQTEAGKMRLERTLGRPFTDKKLIDQAAPG